MKYSKLLTLVILANQATTYASNQKDLPWTLLTESSGEKKHSFIDTSVAIYKNTQDTQEPLPLADQFTCYFFAGKDKQAIDNLWFKKGNSNFEKNQLLKTLFKRACKKFSSYLYEPPDIITPILKLEEEKLLAYKTLLRTLYFESLYYQTIRKSSEESSRMLLSIKNIKEILNTIETTEYQYQTDKNCSYSPYPNPFFIVLLRELLKTKKIDTKQETPFLTTLKSHGLFSKMDRITPSRPCLIQSTQSKEDEEDSF